MKIEFYILNIPAHITNNQLIFHPNSGFLLAVSTVLVILIYFIWLSYTLECQPRA